VPSGLRAEGCFEDGIIFQRREFASTLLQEKENDLRVIGDNDFGIKRTIKTALTKGTFFDQSPGQTLTEDTFDTPKHIRTQPSLLFADRGWKSCEPNRV
jgi:hypothetical protein